MDATDRHSAGSRLLTLASVGTLGCAAVQAVMPFSHSLVRAFDGPSGWSTAALFASSFAFAAILVLVALYPLSAAGRLPRLPLTRVVLVVVGVGFTLRGLPLPAQVLGALGLGPAAGDVSWGGIVTCAGTLVIGWCYVLGLAFSWRMLSPGLPRRHAVPGRQARDT